MRNPARVRALIGMLRALLAAPALLALAACASTPPIPATAPAPAAQPVFDPLTFFTGKLVGEGRLSKVFSSTVSTLVDSTGHMEGDTLHLVQRVKEGDKPERTREWTMRAVGPGRYRGTLTDAQGPVTVETHGNRLHIAFTMKGGFPTEQWLTLSADGTRAYNTMKVRKLGVTVAVLSENIRRVE